MTDFLEDLDLLGSPLFVLDRLPPGVQIEDLIKGLYRAPPRWSKLTAEGNDARLSRSQPGCGFGMVCGHVYDGIDIDPRNGGLASLKMMRDEGLIPRVHQVVETVQGGWHLYIDPLGIGKHTGFLPGIDLQARGSFVFVPPTEGYRVLPRADWPDLGSQPDDAADKLRACVLSESPEAPKSPAPDISTLPTQEELDQAERVLAKAERLMRDAVEGTRNNTLNEWAFPLYGFVKGGCLDQGDVTARLTAAAAACGLPDGEISATLDSALGDAEPSRPRMGSPSDDFGPVDVPSPDLPDWFQRTTIKSILDPNRPPRKYVIEPLILEGTSTAFIAPAGQKKSLLVMAIAMAVARGDAQWAGMTIARARRVVYVDVENVPDDWRDRLLAFGVTHDDPEPENLILLSLPSMPPLDTEQGGRDLLQVVDACGLEPGDVVVLDSYQRVTVAGENDSDTTRGYYRHTGLGLKARGLTVIRLDNSGRDVSKGARGSSGKRDDVDVEYLISSPHRVALPGKPLVSTAEITVGKGRQFASTGIPTIIITVTNGQTTFTSSHTSTRQMAVEECVGLLDQMEVPTAHGEDRVAKALVDAGKDFTRAIIRDAVRTRKERQQDFA